MAYMRAWAIVSLVGLALAAGCGSPPGEFADDGVVAGKIIYYRCRPAAPTSCVRAVIPHNASDWVRAAVRGRRLDAAGGSGAGIDTDHGGQWGDIEVPAGQWEFSVPILEGPGCTPRVRFEIEAGRFYRVRFRFGPPGDCDAIVWSRGFGPGQHAVLLTTSSA
jgi:hypothetical protein